jgi:hypothetical protein
MLMRAPEVFLSSWAVGVRSTIASRLIVFVRVPGLRGKKAQHCHIGFSRPALTMDESTAASN